MGHKNGSSLLHWPELLAGVVTCYKVPKLSPLADFVVCHLGLGGWPINQPPAGREPEPNPPPSPLKQSQVKRLQVETENPDDFCAGSR